MKNLICFSLLVLFAGTATAQVPAAAAPATAAVAAEPLVVERSAANIPMPQTLQLNREGNALLLKQSYGAALDKYVEALRYDPFQAELHLNMGLAFEALQQPEKAMQSYKQAEQLTKKPLVKFMALFNQAQLLGKEKKIDEALSLYQQALEISPTSKEAKTNIELLTQDQQGGGKGDGKNDDKNQDDKNKDNKDDKDKKDPKDDKKDKKDDKKDGDKEDKKQPSPSPKYKPRKFDSKELSESDVKKILGELKQQEQKIRAEFNRKEVKEQPRDKDW